VAPERWEHGSDLHALALQGRPAWPWSPAAVTFAASGREALRQLVAHLGARVVWIPDYCCQDIVAPIERAGARVATYADDPRGPCGVPLAAPGDVVVRLNTWGLRASGGEMPAHGVTLVEDHTHDPFSDWARGSTAHYAFASLRKALPFAEGGALWSPAGLSLPAALPASDTHQRLAADRWRAMELKAQWLAGASLEKDMFRTAFMATEAGFAGDLESGPTARLLEAQASFPSEPWTRARRENLAALCGALGSSGVRLMTAAPAATALGGVFEFPSADSRDRARAALTAMRIYTAVLWPLEGPDTRASPEAIALSKRVMFVHCDGRYARADMERVAQRLNEVFASP
jgi:hypothetical protein